jgi:hypothetical protein
VVYHILLPLVLKKGGTNSARPIPDPTASIQLSQTLLLYVAICGSALVELHGTYVRVLGRTRSKSMPVILAEKGANSQGCGFMVAQMRRVLHVSLHF